MASKPVFCIIVSLLLLEFSITAHGSNSQQCVELGETHIITATLRDGTQTKTVTVGSDASGSPANSSWVNGCLGRCGEGCGSDGGQGNYALDCLVHDVCTFFDEDFGSVADRDCGDEFRNAINDTVTIGRSDCFESEDTVQEFLQER